MFWSSVDTYISTNELLDRLNLTIEQLLDDDHILQRCRERDERLVTFLCRDESLDYLINQICIHKPVTNELDTSIFRHPSLACEILTMGIGDLLDAVVMLKSSVFTPLQTSPDASPDLDRLEDENEDLSKNHLTSSTSSPTSSYQPRLFRLMNAIDNSLDPLSASFISRVIVHLASQRGQIVIPYMRQFPNFITQVVSLFNLTAMPDLLLQLTQQDRGLEQWIFEWFYSENLIPRLVEKLVPSNPPEVHESASRCLIQLISILRNYLVSSGSYQDSDFTYDLEPELAYTNVYPPMMKDDELARAAATRLLDLLESEETVKSLFNHLTHDATISVSVAVNCINVFIALMDKRRPETGFPAPSSDRGTELERSLNRESQESAHSLTAVGDILLGQSSRSGRSNDPECEANRPIDKIRIERACSITVAACLPYLPKLHAALKRLHPQTYNQMPTTAGLLAPPLGRVRLSIVQFLTLLAGLPVGAEVLEPVLKQSVLKTLMDLFEQYPYNTLLHQSVFDLLLAVFAHAGVLKPVYTSSAGTASPMKSEAESRKPTSSPVDGCSSPDLMSFTDSSSVLHPDDLMDVNGNHKNAQSLNQPDDRQQPTAAQLDDVLAAVIVDYKLTDWCLRLSPLLSNLSDLSDESLVSYSAIRPKPGYSGHLLKLANSIEMARNGPRHDFVQSLLDRLPPSSLSSWDAFVANGLAKVNQQQVADNIPTSKTIGDDRFEGFQRFAALSNMMNESAGLINLTGFGNKGKFSFLPPLLNFGIGVTKPLDKYSFDNKLDMSFDTRLGESISDLNGPHLDNTAQSSRFWSYTDKLGFSAQSDAADVGMQFSTDTDEGDFKRARIASISSDESEPDEDSREIDDEDDADDEEEDLKSPTVIKQQRSNSISTTPTVLEFARRPLRIISPGPWGSGGDSPVLSASDGPGGWANFEDCPDLSGTVGNDWASSDEPANFAPVNGLSQPTESTDSKPSDPFPCLDPQAVPAAPIKLNSPQSPTLSPSLGGVL